MRSFVCRYKEHYPFLGRHRKVVVGTHALESQESETETLGKASGLLWIPRFTLTADVSLCGYGEVLKQWRGVLKQGSQRSQTPSGSSAASEHGPLDGNGPKATRRRPPGAVNVGGSVTLRVFRRPSIRPPLLSICPSLLSIFDARLVADAGGEKRASRSGCQGEQERSCDPLSGDRGEGCFHTI